MHVKDDLLLEFNARSTNGDLFLEASGISFSRNRPTLVLMPSGSGRTILAESLAGIASSRSDLVIDCSLKLQKRTISDENAEEAPPIILKSALVPQNPFRYFLELTVKDEIVSPLENADIEYSNAYRRVIEVSREVGIEHLLDRNPLTLSGGEVQRLALAIALVRDPEFLILDEPFGELDIEARNSLSHYLVTDLPSNGVRVCLISSFTNLELLELSNVYVVHQKKLSRLNGLSSEISQILSHLRHKGIYIPSQNMNHPIFSKSKYSNEIQQRNSVTECFVDISKLTFRYPGQKKNALGGISVRLCHGDICAIMGPNGSGKSTLVSIMLGFEKAKKSSIKIYGVIASKKEFAVIRSRTGIAFQTYHHYFFQSTSRSELLESLKKAKQNLDSNFDSTLILGLNVHEPTFFVDEIGKRFALSEVMDEIVDNISVQQRRLLAIACAMIEARDLLVLDEPTAGMDNFGREIITKELLSLSKKRLAVIIISHDLEFLKSCCNRYIELKDGTLIQDGSISSIQEENC